MTIFAYLLVSPVDCNDPDSDDDESDAESFEINNNVVEGAKTEPAPRATAMPKSRSLDRLLDLYSIPPSASTEIMSRRAAIVEEEFDDDTDLPLPNKPLSNTGFSGPLLQEIGSDDDDDELSPSQQAGPASPPAARSQFNSEQMNLKNAVTDITPYKTWTCIYPIYIDAKRPYGTGERRVERAKSVWWPLSKDIADAANRLGLMSLHEVHKTHPRDWENPGRVRVQWKKDGKLTNPSIKTKKQLLEMICMLIQHLKPENVPKPPYNLTSSGATADGASPDRDSPAPTSNKGKAPATHKSKTPLGSAAPAPQRKQSGRRLPVPPEPHPPLASRVSPYSPALSSGVLIETVKAGMNATEGPAGAPGAGNTPANVQKGKRKVIRVRG